MKNHQKGSAKIGKIHFFGPKNWPYSPLCRGRPGGRALPLLAGRVVVLAAGLELLGVEGARQAAQQEPRGQLGPADAVGSQAHAAACAEGDVLHHDAAAGQLRVGDQAGSAIERGARADAGEGELADTDAVGEVGAGADARATPMKARNRISETAAIATTALSWAQAMMSMIICGV